MEKVKEYKSIFKEEKEMFQGDDYYFKKYSDEDAMYQLEMFLDNDGDLYRQQFTPIIKNIQRKLKSGKYDHKLAPKLWMYYVENGAKKFAKDYLDYEDKPQMPWNKVFTKKDRLVLAQKLADFHYDSVARGEYD